MKNEWRGTGGRERSMSVRTNRFVLVLCVVVSAVFLA